jgi:hypothetical protein
MAVLTWGLGLDNTHVYIACIDDVVLVEDAVLRRSATEP